MEAPFTFGMIADGVDFTDRIEETKRLDTNFRSGINTVLISPRRWGKSSLVRHASHNTIQSGSNIRFCFIDLFNVRTEAEFYETLSREVIRASTTKWRNTLTGMGKFFKRIVPVFNISPDPHREFSISLDWEEVKRDPADILNLAESICQDRGIRMVVCIDEFQNIGFYQDPLAFQKVLRSFWQHHKHVSYCLYGSKRHMLMEFFTSASMPFYKFGDLFFLEKIAAEYWVPFIRQRFEDTGKQINAELAGRIADTMENHPYYVQQLAQQTWLVTDKVCTENDVSKAIGNLLRQHDFLFQREVDTLTTTQLNFLAAMTAGVTQFSSKKTVEKFRLGTSGNVKRIKEALENKEIIDILGPQPTFQDPLFRRWLETVYLRK